MDYDLVVVEVLSVCGDNMCVVQCHVEKEAGSGSERRTTAAGSDVIIMNNEYLPPALVVG